MTKKQTKKKQDKSSRVKTFIKTINYNHLMPTRYTLDVDLKSTVTADVLDNPTKKVAARKVSSGTNIWDRIQAIDESRERFTLCAGQLLGSL